MSVPSRRSDFEGTFGDGLAADLSQVRPLEGGAFQRRFRSVQHLLAFDVVHECQQ
jgi:hypothetical protein